MSDRAPRSTNGTSVPGTKVPASRPAVDEVDFFDPAINDCPYRAYETLREEAPVWQDPQTRMWVISRYDDVKAAARDTERFSSAGPVARPARTRR